MIALTIPARKRIRWYRVPWRGKHAKGSHSHYAGRAVDRHAHRSIVLDSAAVPDRHHLGNDDRRRHLAAAALAPTLAWGQANAGDCDHDDRNDAGVRVAVLDRPQH